MNMIFNDRYLFVQIIGVRVHKHDSIVGFNNKIFMETNTKNSFFDSRLR